MFKNGNVELTYEASDYDLFTIKLTPKMVREDVELFLDSLGSAEKAAFIPAEPWKIESAISGRARCRTCDNIISKGALRV